MNEMEQANGGGISEIFQAMSMMWDIHNCENGHHEWKWLGELDLAKMRNVALFMRLTRWRGTLYFGVGGARGFDRLAAE